LNSPVSSLKPPRLQDLDQRRHHADRNHQHRAQFDRQAVFKLLHVAGKVRADLFDLDLELFYVSLDASNVSLDVSNVSFRGQVLLDEFRLGIGQRLGLLFGEPGPP